MSCKECKKRSREDSGGGDIPEWIVTYGDMMTLLLCFFVLLAAFSELKKDSDYQQVVDAIKEAFGYQGGTGMLPITDPPTQSMLKILDEISLKSRTKMKRSQSNVQGMQGDYSRVRRVRNGLMFTLGGNAVFDRESSTLKPEAQAQLRSVGTLLRGRNNKIDIRGHAESKTLSPGSPYHDLDELAFARAWNVKQFLVNEMGIDGSRIYLESRGDSEPMRPRATAPTDQQINRRVEVILTENVVSDFNPDTNFTDAANARGG